MMPVYCPGCNLEVASADPTRIQRNLEVWHESCLRKEQAKEEVTQSTPAQSADPFNWFGMYQ